MERIILVGLGGAAGAIGRYMMSLCPIKGGFPWVTLLTNLLGALLIGFISGLLVHQSLGERWGLFWKTGVCGGFTTFSTFSLELWQLFESGRYLQGGLYTCLSVLGCLGGVILGQIAAKSALRLL